MKKLMIIVAALMITGGISAHGYCGYHGGGYYHGGYGYERVAVHPYYAPYAVAAPVYYGVITTARQLGTMVAITATTVTIEVAGAGKI